MSSTGLMADGVKRQVDLNFVAKLVGWPTPMAGAEATDENNRAGNTDYSRAVESLAGWATPMGGDAKDARNETANRRTVPPTGIHAGQTLVDQVTGWPMAGWPTPKVEAVRTGRDSLLREGHWSAMALEQVAELSVGMVPRELEGANLTGKRALPPGSTPSPYPAATARHAASRLNPAFSLWLMGYLPARLTRRWITCCPGFAAWSTVQPLLDEWWLKQSGSAAAA